MVGRAIFSWDNQTTTIAKSYKIQEVVETHGRPRPEGSRHEEEEVTH